MRSRQGTLPKSRGGHHRLAAANTELPHYGISDLSLWPKKTFCVLMWKSELHEDASALAVEEKSSHPTALYTNRRAIQTTCFLSGSVRNAAMKKWASGVSPRQNPSTEVRKPG